MRREALGGRRQAAGFRVSACRMRARRRACPKTQIPSTKSQTSTKFQIPRTQTGVAANYRCAVPPQLVSVLRISDFGFVWCLVFGIWSLPPSLARPLCALGFGRQALKIRDVNPKRQRGIVRRCALAIRACIALPCRDLLFMRRGALQVAAAKVRRGGPQRSRGRPAVLRSLARAAQSR